MNNDVLITAILVLILLIAYTLVSKATPPKDEAVSLTIVPGPVEEQGDANARTH